MDTVTIFDIKRFAVHDGPGIRTTVFLKGCPLRCWWCHNPESQAAEPFTVDVEHVVGGRRIPGKKSYGERIGLEALLEVVLRDRHFYDESGGGVTFSGGEPLMQVDGLALLLGMCKKEDLHTVVDTCGFAPRKHLGQIMDDTDLFLYDLKQMDPELHLKYTGVDNRLILDNADFLLKEGAEVVFRIPVVPGINTDPGEIGRMIGFLDERKSLLKEVHLLPYHRIAENKYLKLKMEQQLKEIREPDPSLMERLKAQFEETGLKVTIGG